MGEKKEKYTQLRTDTDPKIKKSETNSKEGVVKMETAKVNKGHKERALKKAVAHCQAMHTRQNAERSSKATERNTQDTQAMDAQVSQFKKHAEKAIKTLETSKTQKEFAIASENEKQEKNEVDTAEGQQEKSLKAGANERNRKKDDNDMYVQYMEKENKLNDVQVIDEEKGTKAGMSKSAKKGAIKATMEAKEVSSKASEKRSKAQGDALNSNVTEAVTTPVDVATVTKLVDDVAKQESAETKQQTDETEEQEVNSLVMPAENFTSVYDQLATDAKAGPRRRRSQDRRRRWVDPRMPNNETDYGEPSSQGTSNGVLLLHED